MRAAGRFALRAVAGSLALQREAGRAALRAAGRPAQKAAGSSAPKTAGSAALRTVHETPSAKQPCGRDRQ